MIGLDANLKLFFSLQTFIHNIPLIFLVMEERYPIMKLVLIKSFMEILFTQVSYLIIFLRYRLFCSIWSLSLLSSHVIVDMICALSSWVKITWSKFSSDVG